MSDISHRPPPDLPRPTPGQTLMVERGMASVPAWNAGMVILIGMLLLGLLNAEGLATWASRLPSNPLAERVFALAQHWRDTAEALGLTDILSALRALFHAIEQL